MKLLLDTHTFFWADMEPDRLSPQARSLLADPQNQRLLSSASLWETQIKVMLGKLTLRVPLPDFVGEAESRRSIVVLPIRPKDVFENPVGETRCLVCGSAMGEKSDTCAACGWSYRSQEAAELVV